MKFSVKTVLCTAAALLSVPDASQGQCEFPTNQDVINVAQGMLNTIGKKQEETETITGLSKVHFTCLARVSRDTYSSASVVTNFTTDASPLGRVEQFQLQCVPGVWAGSPFSFFEQNLPAMPFDIQTTLQCSECRDFGPADEQALLTYDPDSNCVCKYIRVCVCMYVAIYVYTHTFCSQFVQMTV